MNLNRFGFKAISKSTEDWAFANMAASGFGCFGIRWSDSRAEDYDGCHIYPETFCQCTGLKDSEGNLIYENDIVRVIDRDYTVVYHEPSMSYEINGETEDRDFSTLVSWVKQGIKCVVVGNKWDKEGTNAKRKTFAERLEGNKNIEQEPITIQIPYELYRAANFAKGEKSVEEYIIEAIDMQIRFDNSMKILDAQLSEGWREKFQIKINEQKSQNEESNS